MVQLIISFIFNTHLFLSRHDRDWATRYYAGFLFGLVLTVSVLSYFVYYILLIVEEGFRLLYGTYAYSIGLIYVFMSVFIIELTVKKLMRSQQGLKNLSVEKSPFRTRLVFSILYCAGLVLLFFFTFILIFALLPLLEQIVI